MTTTERTLIELPTLDAYHADCDRITEAVNAFALHRSAVIDDYPIGGTNRGKCELAFEYKPGHGYRITRRTTNKYGAWCKPHKSTYRGGVVAVVSGEKVADLCGRDTAWLEIDGRGIYLRVANHDCTPLLSSPSYFEPRGGDDDGLEVFNVGNHANVNGCKVGWADSKHCAALWEVWKATYRHLGKTVFERVKALAETQAA